MNSPMRLPTGLLILLLVVVCATTRVPPVGKEGSLQLKEPFFFGSHPRLQERIDNYSELLKTSYANQRGTTGSEHFTERMLPLLVENIQLDLAMGRFDSAQHGIDRVLQQTRKMPACITIKENCTGSEIKKGIAIEPCKPIA